MKGFFSDKDIRAMTEPTIQQLADRVGFNLPDDYNAPRLLWENLPENATRPAIFHDSGIWTYAELVDEAARIGNHLKKYCAPGNRVLLLMDDEPAYPAAIMGSMRAGFVPILTNSQSSADLIAYFLEDSGATAAVVSEEFESLLKDFETEALSCKSILQAQQRPWGPESTELLEHPTLRRDQAFWIYSSGSTGRPKGIVHRHEDAPYTAETYGAYILKLTSDDICFSIPKIFFAYGFGNSVTFPMSRGAAAVLLSGRPTPERVFEQIAKHRPSVLFGLPTLYTLLMHSAAADTADLSCVRLCISAAEILSKELTEKWKSHFGLTILEGLGSTEMLHIYLSNDETLQKATSAGRIVPGYAVKLLGADDREVSPDEKGEMYVRGLSGTEIYWNHPKKTSETIGDGWIKTGDLFVMDEDGFYYFKGRADDLVKVSGQWVYPMEIETSLNEHPKVKECCVQVIELADMRHTIKAWVVLVDGVDASQNVTKELQRFVKSKLLPYKYPREVVYLEALPKTGTNKIDRQALRKSIRH